MMKRLILLFVCAAQLSGPALAAGPPGGTHGAGRDEGLPPGALYRYRTDSGRLVITSTLPQEAIYLGYEIIDSQGHLIATVEKALPEEERIKLRGEMLARERDQRLLRLYPTPKDAIRARDRQIEAIRLAIDYASSTMAQLGNKLSQEVSAAASYERQGRPIPENMQATIDLYTRQIREQEQEIERHRGDIEQLKAEFESVISRLRQIEARAESR